MSRVFTDPSLLSWEVFTSAGPFGLPQQPKIVFLCLSDPDRRARYVRHGGTTVTAQRAVRELSDAELKELFEGSQELS